VKKYLLMALVALVSLVLGTHGVAHERQGAARPRRTGEETRRWGAAGNAADDFA
jgi:hypothetical protein